MAKHKIKLKDIVRIAALQCTYEEAGAFFSLSRSGFTNLLRRDPRAQLAWDQGKGSGKVSLRRKQSRLASDSAPMAIWLGKQYLGQEDKVVNEHTGKDGGPIETADMGALNADERKSLRGYLTRVVEGRSKGSSEQA